MADRAAASERLDGTRNVYLRLAHATSETHGWGTPRDGASVTGAPLRIGNVTFRRGIGTHAPAELAFDVGENYRWLTFYAGISAEMTAAGSVAVQIWLDGKKAHETPVMRVKEQPVYVSIPLKGVKKVRLVGTDAGDGNGADHLCLGNLRLCVDTDEPAPDGPKPQAPRMISPVAEARDYAPRRGAVSTVPARRWETCMLTGNGNLGAMVFGRPYEETVVVNHHKLYLPLGSREIVEDLAASMPRYKEAGLKAGRTGPAVVHNMMREDARKKIVNTDPFHPAFMLRLSMLETSQRPRDYITTEDFETGEVKVRWTDEHGDWERRLFASRPDNVLAMLIEGPAGKVGCELAMEIRHQLVEAEIRAAGEWLSAHAVYTRGKGGYDAVARVVATGGRTEADHDQLRVTGADRILILMDVRTWRTPLPRERSEAWAFSPEHPDLGPGYPTDRRPEIRQHLARLNPDYDTLVAAHATVHRELFSRVSLDLGRGTTAQLNSEELLKRAAAEDRMPPGLMELMYDACRYLTICSAGVRPPNLQGIWTGTWSPAWSGDYTLDSNIQLEVQSMMTCNMPELMLAYVELVESWLPDCRLNARKLYGCRGIVSNPRASNVCLLLHWGRWPGEQAIGCMGWMLHFFYDYYLFTGDREFLAERVVPPLKESVLFYEDLLAGTEDANGKFRFFISYSPEHRLDANSTFDISVAKAMLSYLIAACEELGIERENLPRWRRLREKMPPYLINDAGGLQEWSWPGAGEDFNQRHHSHLLPLYQFCEFDRDRTPRLWQAAGVAFQGKVEGWLHREKGANSNHITHGMANQGQCAARLGRSEIVWEVLSRMATRRYIYPSFMMSYWPGLKGFGFDPVGTIPDIVNNSLLFAWAGTVDLLPALPREWPKGSIRGIRARGHLAIDCLEWDLPQRRIELTLTSGKAQQLTLRLPERWTFTDATVVQGAAALTPGIDPGSRTLAVPASRALKIDMRVTTGP